MAANTTKSPKQYVIAVSKGLDGCARATQSSQRFSHRAKEESLCASQSFSQLVMELHHDSGLGVCSRFRASRISGSDAVLGDARHLDPVYRSCNPIKSRSA